MTWYALLAVASYLAWWHFVCFRGKVDLPYGRWVNLNLDGPTE